MSMRNEDRNPTQEVCQISIFLWERRASCNVIRGHEIVRHWSYLSENEWHRSYLSSVSYQTPNGKTQSYAREVGRVRVTLSDLHDICFVVRKREKETFAHFALFNRMKWIWIKIGNCAWIFSDCREICVKGSSPLQHCHWMVWRVTVDMQ